MEKMIVSLLCAGLSFQPLGASTVVELPNTANIGWVATDHHIGSVTLSNDGTMTITYDRDISGDIVPDLRLRPQQKVYKSYLEMVGGLRPGETKPLYRYAGIAKMNDDRTLSVQWSGSNSPGQPIVEPWRQFINAEDPLYEKIILRVGGLKPGQAKGIP